MVEIKIQLKVVKHTVLHNQAGPSILLSLDRGSNGACLTRRFTYTMFPAASGIANWWERGGSGIERLQLQ
jgi:hypothetical protein